MASVEVLLQEFTKTFSGTSTEAIKDAEKKLLELEKDGSFLPNCLLLLTEPQVQCTSTHI